MATKKKINFFDDDDEEDSGSAQRGGSNDYGRGIGNMQTRIAGSQDRTIESQRRALQSIAQSEEMGVATAEELIRQREVLENADKQLDSIQVMQDTSQRHINNLSSVFGGIKNYFSRKKSANPASKELPEGIAPGDSRTDNLRRTVDKDFERHESRHQTQLLSRPPPSDAREAEIEGNIATMGDGVARLKNLASGLGNEIESQNELLDRMQPKIERVNTRMDTQQKDLNRLLYGKK